MIRRELRRLEEFTHSAIREQIADMIKRSSEQVVVVEVPLLTDFMGTGWIRVVVDADPGARLDRLRGAAWMRMMRLGVWRPNPNEPGGLPSPTRSSTILAIRRPSRLRSRPCG